ncbi:hypothetical protein ACMX9J_14340 [Priestia sp. RMT2NF4]|uniref:hypothetical protein n=1 Tax=Priestia sp. RMT2NF4 TaxID=3398394 RepID=UPI003A4C8263
MGNILTRSELEYHFDAVLNNNYKDIKSNKKYSYGRNAVKSYIIETHIFKENPLRDRVLASVLARAKEIDSETKLHETNEESLIYLETEQLDFYVDIADPRYMVFHSADPTKQSDPFIKKFYSANGYDSIWLPVPLLLQTIDFGKFWGMSVSFQQALDEPENDEIGGPEETQDVSLSVKRHFAKTFFETLINSDINNMLGISKLSILRGDSIKDSSTDRKFIIDDIKYNGKLTAKGNSFSRHSRLVYELVNLYGDVIDKFETYGMSFEEGYLSGNPFTITFSKKIEPKKLVDLMFNGNQPFRLWGMEDEIGHKQYRVYAVDMHNGNHGNKLTFEITSDYIRVSLPKHACANTLLRLFANLNHYVDAMAKMEVVNYELKVDLSRTRLS